MPRTWPSQRGKSLLWPFPSVRLSIPETWAINRAKWCSHGFSKWSSNVRNAPSGSGAGRQASGQLPGKLSDHFQPIAGNDKSLPAQLLDELGIKPFHQSGIERSVEIANLARDLLKAA